MHNSCASVVNNIVNTALLSQVQVIQRTVNGDPYLGS